MLSPEISVDLPFFIAFIVVGICAFYFVMLSYHYGKQLRKCKKELEKLRYQSDSPLDNNLSKPQT